MMPIRPENRGDEDLVSTDEGALILGVKPATVRSWRAREYITPAGILPARGRGGIVPLYRLRDLRRCAEERATRRENQYTSK